MLTIDETLDLARSITAHRVEKSFVDGDGFDINIGDRCTVGTYSGRLTQLYIEGALGASFKFGNVTAAIQAADTYETVMLAIAEAAKASREPQEVA